MKTTTNYLTPSSDLERKEVLTPPWSSPLKKVAESLANKYQCHVILRDVAKAFDKVWHAGLEFKILLPGLPDISTKSICTFIDNRITYINIKHYNGPSF